MPAPSDVLTVAADSLLSIIGILLLALTLTIVVAAAMRELRNASRTRP